MKAWNLAKPHSQQRPWRLVEQETKALPHEQRSSRVRGSRTWQKPAFTLHPDTLFAGIPTPCHQTLACSKPQRASKTAKGRATRPNGAAFHRGLQQRTIALLLPRAEDVRHESNLHYVLVSKSTCNHRITRSSNNRALPRRQGRRLLSLSHFLGNTMDGLATVEMGPKAKGGWEARG